MTLRAQAFFASVILLCSAGSSSAFDLSDAVRLDAKISMPARAKPREEYIRYYLSADIQTQDDLPFTTMRDDFGFRPGRLVVGVFVLPAEFGIGGPPGVHVVQSAAQLPYAVHGGCRAVNLVADQDDRTIGSWCNVDEDAPLPLPPKRKRRS